MGKFHKLCSPIKCKVHKPIHTWLSFIPQTVIIIETKAIDPVIPNPLPFTKQRIVRLKHTEPVSVELCTKLRLRNAKPFVYATVCAKYFENGRCLLTGSLLCSAAHSGGSVLGDNARFIETSPLP